MAEHNGYGLVYQNVLRDKRLTIEAKAIYAYLCGFAGTTGSCYPSIELMLDELGISSNRFYKHLKPLVDYGYVSKYRPRKDGTQWERTIYTIHSSAHIRNEDMEKHLSRVENNNVRILDMGNVEPKNISSTNNRLFKNNSDQQICDFTERICKILNRAKAKTHSKGRLKPNEYTIRNLLNAGCSFEQIEVVAKCFVTDNKDASWLDLERACKKQYNLRLNL